VPALDLFADLQFDDKVGMLMFLQAHAARHSIYQQAAAYANDNFADTNLTTYPDDDWFNRHYSVHAQLAQLIVPTPTSSLSTLIDYDWSSADSFYTWMQTHNAIHDQIDQYFGINS